MGSNCKKIYLRGSRMKILKSIRNLFWVRKSTSIKNQSSFIIYQSKGLQFTSQNIVKNGGVAGGTRLLHAGGMGKSCSNLDRLACKSHSLSSLFFPCLFSDWRKSNNRRRLWRNESPCSNFCTQPSILILFLVPARNFIIVRILVFRLFDDFSVSGFVLEFLMNFYH